MKRTQSEYDAIPAADFGDPKGRRYPIQDDGDLMHAGTRVGREGSGPDEIKQTMMRIISIANKKKLKVPEGWKYSFEGKKLIEMSHSPVFLSDGYAISVAEANMPSSVTALLGATGLGRQVLAARLATRAASSVVSADAARLLSATPVGRQVLAEKRAGRL